MDQDSLMHPFLRSQVTSTSSSKKISLTEVVLMASRRIVLNVLLFSVGLQENCSLAKSPDVTQWGEHAHKHICKMTGRPIIIWILLHHIVEDTSFCSESDRKCHPQYSNTVFFQLHSSYIGTEEEINSLI